MAGKLLTILTILIGAITLLLINFKDTLLISTPFLKILIIIMYFSLSGALILSLLALLYALKTVNPLSSKGLNKTDISLLSNREKPWIESSLIYYRGLVDFLSKNKDKGVLNEYSKVLNKESVSDDLIRQIFILAKYSDHKRSSLEKSFNLMRMTLAFFILGIIIAGIILIMG